MRDIKFRAWDKINNRMTYDVVRLDNDGIKISEKTTNDIEEWDLIFMQYTGLKDKNGEEIYEGDIVYATFSGMSKVKGEVVFRNGAFNVKSTINGLSYSTFTFTVIDEVIGNIYENPERLGEK